MLKEDQAEHKAFVRKYYWAEESDGKIEAEALVKQHRQERAGRMLDILDVIGEPSIKNIGRTGAQAISVLALHQSLTVLQRVCQAFVDCYEQDRDNTYYQAIPSMVDWIRILERKPQVFATQWAFDDNKLPYIPTVEHFADVNIRRKEYGLEPLRWPKSLAISETEQPWLKRPIEELTMRDITDAEFAAHYQEFLER